MKKSGRVVACLDEREAILEVRVEGGRVAR